MSTVDKDAIGCLFAFVFFLMLATSIGYVEVRWEAKKKACLHRCIEQGFYASDYSYSRNECKCLTADDVLGKP